MELSIQKIKSSKYPCERCGINTRNLKISFHQHYSYPTYDKNGKATPPTIDKNWKARRANRWGSNTATICQDCYVEIIKDLALQALRYMAILDPSKIVNLAELKSLAEIKHERKTQKIKLAIEKQIERGNGLVLTGDTL